MKCEWHDNNYNNNNNNVFVFQQVDSVYKHESITIDWTAQFRF